MFGRLVVQGAEYKIGTVTSRPLRGIQNQIEIARLVWIDVKVLAQEAATLMAGFVDFPLCHPVIHMKSTGEVGDAIFAVADQAQRAASSARAK